MINPAAYVRQGDGQVTAIVEIILEKYKLPEDSRQPLINTIGTAINIQLLKQERNACQPPKTKSKRQRK